MPSNRQSGRYVLMTAAHNEEAFIEGAIRSVLSQTIMPERWVVVSDNSSDRTDAIVGEYAAEYDFIHFLQLKRPPGRNFGAKVRALHKGCELLKGVSYEFIGNLDGDVSLEPDYFEQLIRHFSENGRLGIAGGFKYEDSGHGYRSRKVNNARDVTHAAQLVRRECYEAIGAYAVLKHGGEDWFAQTQARMLGWEAESFPQLKIFHHRHTGSVSSPVRNSFRLGNMDYAFGSDPAFEIAKCLRRINDKPYCLVALARLAGFIWPYCVGEEREVSAEFASYLRREQRERLWSGFNTVRTVRPMSAAGRDLRPE
jgi:biofilm PGA synthesis N-glycosyltransferase PgaC